MQERKRKRKEGRKSEKNEEARSYCIEKEEATGESI